MLNGPQEKKLEMKLLQPPNFQIITRTIHFVEIIFAQQHMVKVQSVVPKTVEQVPLPPLDIAVEIRIVHLDKFVVLKTNVLPQTPPQLQ